MTDLVHRLAEGGRVRAAGDLLAAARDLVLPVYQALAKELPAELHNIIGYHAGWLEEDGKSSVPKDKCLRPALTFATTAAVLKGGASGSPRSAAANPVTAAVAVQLVHDFSLLHDDIMDEDLTRRHRPAAWTVFGVGRALLAGDWLVSRAIRLLAEDGTLVSTLQVEALTKAFAELCQGQALDVEFERCSTVSAWDCLRMIEAKTGALVGCACELGALAGGADASQAATGRRFGRRLGVAFQLVDDLLGIWGDPEVTGKPVRSDLARRKKTLPVILALTSPSPEAHELARLVESNDALDEEALTRAAALVEEAGGRARAELLAARAIDETLSLIGEVVPDGAADDLRTLTRFVIARNR